MTRNRLSECRRYLGFSLGEVAAHLRTDVRSVDLMEDTGVVDDASLWKLAHLYRRTPGYLRGTESPAAVCESAERAISSRKLSPSDAGELRSFARFLDHRNGNHASH